MKKYGRLCIFLILIGMGMLVACIAEPPEPKRCALCGFIKSHAPCLVQLETGEVGELMLYDPHPVYVGELAEEQVGGELIFFYPAGCRGIRLTEPWKLTVEVPSDEGRMRKAYFCRECRELLKGYDTGFVLADLYIPGRPVVYSVYDGAEYRVRCYEVFIEESRDGKVFAINMVGMLETGSS